MRSKVARSAAVATLLVMFVATGAAIRELPGVSLENSVETWLSDDDPEARVLQWCREKFPEKNEVLVSWKGSSLDDRRVEKLAESLAGGFDENGNRVGQLDCIDDVVTPGKLLDRMLRQDVDPSRAIESLRGTLIGFRDTDHQSREAPVAILVRLSESGAADAGASLKAIRDAASGCGIESQDLHLGGSTVTSSALDDEVMNAIWNETDPFRRPPVFLLSGLAGAFLAIVMLKSVRLGLMVLVCACITALLGTALIPVFGHTMNMVLIVMPTLLVVLSLSAAIHVANYWKHAAMADPNNSIRRAVSTAWLPCLLAALTTGIGLISLTISPLSPIRDFGVYSSIGILISLVIVLGGLPALMIVFPVISPTRSSSDHVAWRWLASSVSQHSVAISSISTFLFLATAGGLYWFRSDVKVERYFPGESRLTADYEFLESNLGGIAPVEILISFDDRCSESLGFLDRMELIRSVERLIRQHPEISGALSLADFQPELPPLAENASFLTRTQRAIYERTLESRVKQTEMADASAFLTADSRENMSNWHPGAPLDEIWRIRAQACLAGELNYGELTAALNKIVTTALRGRPEIEHVVTGTVPVFFRAQEALLRSLIQSFCLAFAVIGLAMAVLLRSFSAGALSILPNLMPAGMVFGGLSWCGQVLDIGTMLTASVALGVSVDGVLHLLTWFRKAISEGESRQEAVAFALQHCGPAMLQTSAVVGFSLLVLYPAELLLISRFGWVMAALLAVALVAELVVLPVLLIGPLGHVLERSVRAAECRRKIPECGLSPNSTKWKNQSSDGSAELPRTPSIAEDPDAGVSFGHSMTVPINQRLEPEDPEASQAA